MLRYLVETRDMVRTVVGGEEFLFGHVDAYYAGDLDHRNSTSGFVVSVFGGAVAWGSKKETAVATSTVRPNSWQLVCHQGGQMAQGVLRRNWLSTPDTQVVL